MAGEIEIAYGTTGRTLYAVVRSSTGTVWNTAGAAFEAFNAANWADYDIALTEQGASGYYVGTFPAATAGVYNVEARDRAGGSPAVTDAVAGAGAVEWDGSAATYLASRPTLAEILAGGDVDGYTLEQTLKLCLAALAGKLSGAATTTVTIRAADDSKARLTATVDADGNRTAITYDAAG